MSSAATVAVAGLLLAIAAGVGGYGYGLDQGKALEKGRQDSKALETITDQIAAHADLVKRSGAASKGMRAAVAQLEKANTQTTTEIADALHILPLLSALIACSLLTSCAASKAPATALPKQPPAEYAVRCPAPPPAPRGVQVDPVALELKSMYDLYGLCAGRMTDLLNWLDTEGLR